jgi:hypothetical protein
MPVFTALAGGKVPLYHPIGAPAGGKILYGLLKELQRAVNQLQRAVKYFTAPAGATLPHAGEHFGVDIFFCCKTRETTQKT